MSRTLTQLRKRLREGAVIPAHPLALALDGGLDERRQRALTRYYLSSGAGGVAIGVHTTQFEIRDPQVGLLQPVLELGAEVCREFESPKRPILKIAGVCGASEQAVAEAALASDLGYDAGLISLAELPLASDDDLIEHCRLVAEAIPLFGFYLQPAVGGRELSFEFWRRFVEIENVVAIKIAPFDRYRTFDVVRAVAESGRRKQIALYTGNDDSIVTDLVNVYRFQGKKKARELRMVGGLLGHWAFWTRRAVECYQECRRVVENKLPIPGSLLVLGNQITDANAAVFDARNRFAGCLAGIHEVLRRQGLLEGLRLLDPKQGLSPGQAEEIDRVWSSYPHLVDDIFVASYLDEWLR